MRRKAMPKDAGHAPGEPQMQAKTAAVLAGHYAVCLCSSSGRLSAIGKALAEAEPVIAELADGTHDHVQLFGAQRLVIGICCRYLRRWVEPRFLPFRRAGSEPAEPIEEDEQ